MSTRFVVSAPAKLNLHLEVLGTRPDGYHELRTLLVSIDLADELVGEESSGELELTVRPPGTAPAGENNLVLRAARALREARSVDRGARLELTKRIPSGSGLGGGSADAAATLVLLERLWGLEPDPTERLQIAADLGSDVPFFLHGGLAFGFGRGDEVIPLPDLPTRALVLLLPPVAIPTVEVYDRLGATADWAPANPRVLAFACGLTTDPPWSILRNDLEPIVTDGWPEVDDALDRLRSGSAAERAAVTGSGAAVFALYSHPAEARAVFESLAGGGRLYLGRTLARNEARLEARELGPRSDR